MKQFYKLIITIKKKKLGINHTIKYKFIYFKTFNR